MADEKLEQTPIESKPVKSVADLTSLTDIVKNGISAELSAQLAKLDGHEQRVELLLVEIIIRLKSKA